MTTRNRTIAAASISVALLAAACSSSKSGGTKSGSTKAGSTTATTTASTPATTTSAATTAVATGSGACKYVSTAQASQLAASPVKAGVERPVAAAPITFKYCDFIFDPGNAPGVTIAIADLNGAGVALFQQFRLSKQGSNDFQDVAGVGAAAFYADQNLNILKGNTGVILFVGRANGSPRGPGAIPDEKALAQIVLPQL